MEITAVKGHEVKTFYYHFYYKNMEQLENPTSSYRLAPEEADFFSQHRATAVFTHGDKRYVIEYVRRDVSAEEILACRADDMREVMDCVEAMIPE